MTRGHWLNLDRVFVAMPENDGVPASLLGQLGSAKHWSDLLQYRCAVVVGEAGTGKTREFEAQAKLLTERGESAFFLRIETLGTATDLEHAFYPGDWNALVRWKASTRDAWFFLDSVDESKLRGTRLHSALLTLARGLGPALCRARVLLSCRVSDWSAADRDAVDALHAQMYPTSDASRSAPLPCVSPFQVVPLDETRVARLAIHLGVVDPGAFLDAVRDANAWMFSERPLDLQWLVDYWNRHHRLGSLTELLSYSVGERAKGRFDRPSILSVEEVRTGTRQLALAAALCGAAAFRLPDDPRDARTDNVVDPQDVLRHFRSDQIADLLTRGPFDEATYGRIRFHHRNTQDFLAAEAILAMLDAGLSWTELQPVLFSGVEGDRTVPQHLVPVVAWLAARERRVSQLAIDAIPEHLIDEGDPAALSPGDRRLVLVAYAKRYADRGRVFHHFDPVGLRRFACPEVVETVRELLVDPDSPDHLVRTLLLLVEKGRLTALAETAFAIATSTTASSTVVCSAVRAAMVAPPSNAHLDSLHSVAMSPATDPDVVSAFVSVLFPGFLSVDDLLKIVKRSDLRNPSGLEGLFGEELVGRGTTHQRQALLDGLLATVPMSKPLAPWTGDDIGQAEPQGVELLLLATVVAVISAGPPFPESLPVAIDLLTSADERGVGGRQRLARCLANQPAARRAIFWRRVASRVAAGRRFPRGEIEIGLRDLFSLGASDVAWLSRDAADRSVVQERVLAFNCLLTIRATDESPEERVTRLREVASSSSLRHGDVAVEAHLERAVRRENELPSEAALQAGRRKKYREAREAAVQRRNHARLRDTLPALATGDYEIGLLHLYDRCLGSQSTSDFSCVDLSIVRSTYDADVASAAESGFRRFWRNRAPQAPEVGEENSTPNSAILGLVGLHLEAAAGEDISLLPKPLVRNAIAYASWELNHFPAWLDSCAARHPELICEVFAPAIHRDYNRVPERGDASHGRLLWKLPRASVTVRAAAAPLVVSLLRIEEPSTKGALTDALGSVVGTNLEAEVRAVAPTRTTAAETTDAFIAWWLFWAAGAPHDAVDALRARSERANEPKLVEAVASSLASLHDPDAERARQALWRDLPAMVAMIRVVFGNVRAEDDVSHRGIYTPSSRDAAQEFRSRLLHGLADMPGRATIDALEDLSGDPLFGRWRDLILHLLQQRRASDAVGPPMAPADAISFAARSFRPPKTSAELFAIALGRLADIVHDLCHGDFSVRGVYNPKSRPVREEEVQNLLASRLDLASRCHYSVVREPEVTRKKRPDIRLVHPGGVGPTTIEIKIAEHWTLEQLLEGLERQLVNQYMQANGSGHGVYVLCSSGPEHHWKCADGGSIRFDVVVERVKMAAAKLETEVAWVDALEVIAIDLH